jgi:hypothetical protein
MADGTQVNQPVVISLAIDVVNFCVWPPAMHDKPRQSVSKINV